MTTTHLAAWADDRGNVIEYDGPAMENVVVTFRGENNRLIVSRRARIAPGPWNFSFDNSNAMIKVRAGRPHTRLRPSVRVGQDATVVIGRHVSSTAKVLITAAEGATVRIGQGTLISHGVEIRADDSHAIFDIRTGRRVNRSSDITIGPHVWLGARVVVLAGATIGEGSVVGIGGVVTKPLPNNVVAVGAPAVAVRRDIAWEPAPLTKREPAYKLDASAVTKSEYWRLTGDPAAFGHEFAGPVSGHPATRRMRAQARRAVHRVRRLLRS